MLAPILSLARVAAKTATFSDLARTRISMDEIPENGFAVVKANGADYFGVVKCRTVDNTKQCVTVIDRVVGEVRLPRDPEYDYYKLTRELNDGEYIYILVEYWEYRVADLPGPG